MKHTIMLAAALALAACAPSGQTSHALAAPQRMDEDSLIFTRTITRARLEHLDTLPIGEVIARVGKWFVGTPYTPYTLEEAGPEHLVINLRTFDCQTFLENMLAFGRVIKMERADFATFKRELTRLRYRDGKLAGYPSRLHYFSEWIANNDAKGIARNLTPELGVVDAEPIDFMSTHRAAYKALAGNDAFLAQIQAMEKRISAVPRYMIPEDRIAALESKIHNGDLIAMTSSLKGLDVAHTGLALWVAGRLHLMHAPLVGDSVEISAKPLADRVIALATQDGIMVARPLEPR